MPSYALEDKDRSMATPDRILMAASNNDGEILVHDEGDSAIIVVGQEEFTVAAFREFFKLFLELDLVTFVTLSDGRYKFELTEKAMMLASKAATPLADPIRGIA